MLLHVSQSLHSITRDAHHTTRREGSEDFENIQAYKIVADITNSHDDLLHWSEISKVQSILIAPI